MTIVFLKLGLHKSQGITIVLAFLLFSTFLLSSSSAAISTNGTIDFTGKIGYSTSLESDILARADILFGAGRPHYLYDQNKKPLDFSRLVDLMASTNAKVWREGAGQYNYDAEWYVNLKTLLDAKGIKLFIQPFQPSIESEAGWKEQIDIVYNNSGAQTEWINYWAHFISQVRPYAIMVMNEYRNYGGQTPATQVEFAAYRQFCINCITVWRAVKPDLVVVVGNAPFNALFDSTSYGFAANPLPFSNIVYSCHIYYAYDLGYPPSYLPEQQAYWNGNLSQAKRLLEDFIDRSSYALLSKDQQVIWDEMGANLAAPNAKNYVQDFYDICEARGMDLIYYDFVPYSTVPGVPGSPTGLLTSDWNNLNEMGLVWNSKMQ